jgi:hypothetical protein
MLQNTTRAPSGSFSAGRSTMAEYSARSRGIMDVMGAASSLVSPGKGGAASKLRLQSGSQALVIFGVFAFAWRKHCGS